MLKKYFNCYIDIPNKKVNYFKNLEEINEKIKHIKDIDSLGFDSISNIIFKINFLESKKI